MEDKRKCIKANLRFATWSGEVLVKVWHSITVEPLDQRCELAGAMEQCGFAGAALSDHLIVPIGMSSPYPYTKDNKAPFSPSTMFPDLWQTIAAMAAVTKSLEFMTAIYILPLRDVVSVAKALSTAAVISNNRIMFGIGMGWMEEEFTLTGQSFRNRGERGDEMLEIIQMFMKDGIVEYHGKHHDFAPVQMDPVPGCEVPVIVGGETEPGIRRAARLGGWITAPKRPDAFAEPIARYHAVRKEMGLYDKPTRICAIIDGPLELEECRRLGNMGVTDVMLTAWPAGGTRAESVERKKRYLEDVSERLIQKL